MDKNTGIGLVLIAAILIGFSLFNRPSEEELARRQHVQDSIALVNRQKAEAMAQQSAVNDSLRALAAQEKNVIFGGRLAEYKYYDMAPVVEKVLALFE